MPKLTQANYDAIRSHLFNRIHRTGEEIKNDFPNILRMAIEEEAWRNFTRGDGTPFKDLVEWLHYSFPNGLSMGGGRHVISYEDALQLTKTTPDVHRVLLENRPNLSGKKKSTLSTAFIQPKNVQASAYSLSVRLAQQYPKYYEAYMRGEYKSITAAAIAAGILQNNVNLRRCKSAYGKLTEDERKEFETWRKKFRREAL